MNPSRSQRPEPPSDDVLAIQLDQHARWLRSLARGLTQDTSSADDLAQESWAALTLRARQSGDPVIGIRAWLAGTARHIATGWRVGKARREAREAQVARRLESPDSSELAERLELARVIAEELERLRPPYREVLALRYLEDLSVAEIARRRRAPLGTIRAQVTRGTAELRSALERRLGDRSQWMPALAAIGGIPLPQLALAPAPTALLAMKLVTPVIASLALAACSYWFFVPPASDPRVELAALAQGLEEDRSPSQDLDSKTGVLRVEAAQAAPDTEAMVEPTSSLEYPLRGRLIDAATGEPLPDFALEVSLDGKKIDLTTDSLGGFESEDTFPAGTAALRWIDHEDLPRRPQPATELPHPREELDVKVAAGPTYRLDCALPTGTSVDDFFVRIETTRSVNTVDLGPVAALRSGPLLWARFGPFVSSMGNPGPWRVHLEHRQGWWRGSADVTTNVGAGASPLEINLEAYGALSVQPLGPDGPVLTQRNLSVRALDGQSEQRWGSQLTLNGGFSTEGVFELRALPAGRYEVSLEAERFQPAEAQVVVELGRTTDYKLRLLPRHDLGGISGTFSSRSGQADLRGTYVEAKPISPTDGRVQGPSFHCQPTMKGGKFVFRFEELPPGTYRIRPFGGRKYIFEPETLEAQPGTSHLHFECRDDLPPLTTLVLCLVDGDSGAPLPDADVLVRFVDQTSGKRSGYYTRTDGHGCNEITVPRGARLSWMARCRGFASVTGDASDLEGGRKTPIEMLTGWGEELTVLHLGEPVTGVGIALDGRRVGETDRDGRIHLTQGQAPERITLVSEDWHPVPGGSVSIDGSYTASRMGLLLRVAR